MIKNILSYMLGYVTTITNSLHDIVVVCNTPLLCILL